MKMKMKCIFLGHQKWLWPILVFLLLSSSVNAQDNKVNGTVLDEENEPLIGVSVTIQGTTQGTITDVDGKFSLIANSDDILVFSFIGYITTSLPVNNQSNIEIKMDIDLKQLDEVVVVGYGTQKKSHLTGSISKVKNEKLDQMPLSRADDALVGRVSGVNIQATGGEGNDQGVGGAPQIRIRGTGSITGNSGPLLVIDGAVVDADFWSNIDMNDIESFEVLKDAASASIFGSRGANGVIMITTKQGSSGKTKFSYNGFVGVQDVKRNPDYNMTLSTSLARELAANGVLSERSQVKQLLAQAAGETDWQDVIFDGGSVQSHSLSARGGNDKTKFSTVLTYMHDEGVLLTDDLKKYNLKAKIDTKVNDKLSFGVSLNPSYSERRRFDGSTHDILRQTPWLPVYLDENSIQFVNRTRDGGRYADAQIGDYAVQRMFDDYDLEEGRPSTGSGIDISNTSNTNPAAKVAERDRRDFKFKTFGRAYVNFDIFDGLSFRTALTASIQDTQRKRWQGVKAHRNGAANAQSDKTDEFATHVIAEAFLNYNKTFGDHEISATGGIVTERRKHNFSTARVNGFKFDYIETFNGGSILSLIDGYERQKRLESYVFRANYSYKDKYLASVSVRRDGSSVFGTNQKYSNYPALSFGWRVSEEDFLKGNDIISNLKFRVSYGITGNDNFRTSGGNLVNWYPYVSIFTANSAVVDNALIGGFNAQNVSNPDLKWERSLEINPAIDFGLLDDRITGSFDYYKRTSDQLLIDQPISATTGFSNALQNIGEVTNEGFEFEIRTYNLRTNNFSWSTTFLGSRNKNTLTDFADANGQIINVDSKRAAEWINLEGNPISSYYGYVVDRDIPLEYIKDPFHPVGAEAQDVYVKDLNGDGIIDEDDKTILGDPYPAFIWSINNEFNIGDFDMSFMFQGSHGAEVRNMGDQYLYNHFNSAQDFDPTITPDQEFIQQKIFTSDIIQDASYVSLRNLNVGYTVPAKFLKQYGISRARVYFSGQNLIYLKSSNYTGFNPEAIEITSPISYGYQRGGGPIARKYVLGLNLEF